jgi:hypothetical protein
MPACQFVVQLADQPGSLAKLLELLAARGLDLRSIGAGAIAGTGAAVLVLNDADAARAVLNTGGYTFVEGEVIVTSAPDQPGAVASLARRLADAGVNVQGLAILRWHQGKAEIALSVDNPHAARRVLGTSTPGAAIV